MKAPTIRKRRRNPIKALWLWLRRVSTPPRTPPGHLTARARACDATTLEALAAAVAGHRRLEADAHRAQVAVAESERHRANLRQQVGELSEEVMAAKAFEQGCNTTSEELGVHAMAQRAREAAWDVERAQLRTEMQTQVDALTLRAEAAEAELQAVKAAAQAVEERAGAAADEAERRLAHAQQSGSASLAEAERTLSTTRAQRDATHEALAEARAAEGRAQGALQRALQSALLREGAEAASTARLLNRSEKELGRELGRSQQAAPMAPEPRGPNLPMRPAGAAGAAGWAGWAGSSAGPLARAALDYLEYLDYARSAAASGLLALGERAGLQLAGWDATARVDTGQWRREALVPDVRSGAVVSPAHANAAAAAGPVVLLMLLSLVACLVCRRRGAPRGPAARPLVLVRRGDWLEVASWLAAPQLGSQASSDGPARCWAALYALERREPDSLRSP